MSISPGNKQINQVQSYSFIDPQFPFHQESNVKGGETIFYGGTPKTTSFQQGTAYILDIEISIPYDYHYIVIIDPLTSYWVQNESGDARGTILRQVQIASNSTIIVEAWDNSPSNRPRNITMFMANVDVVCVQQNNCSLSPSRLTFYSNETRRINQNLFEFTSSMNLNISYNSIVLSAPRGGHSYGSNVPTEVYVQANNLSDAGYQIRNYATFVDTDLYVIPPPPISPQTYLSGIMEFSPPFDNLERQFSINDFILNTVRIEDTYFSSEGTVYGLTFIPIPKRSYNFIKSRIGLRINNLPSTKQVYLMKNYSYISRADIGDQFYPPDLSMSDTFYTPLINRGYSFSLFSAPYPYVMNGNELLNRTGSLSLKYARDVDPLRFEGLLFGRVYSKEISDETTVEFSSFGKLSIENLE